MSHWVFIRLASMRFYTHSAVKHGPSKAVMSVAS